MKLSAHTADNAHYWIETDGGMIVAQIPFDAPDPQGLATLLASAPELLAACSQALFSLTHYGCAPMTTKGMLERAIQKAEGGDNAH